MENVEKLPKNLKVSSIGNSASGENLKENDLGNESGISHPSESSKSEEEKSLALDTGVSGVAGSDISNAEIPSRSQDLRKVSKTEGSSSGMCKFWRKGFCKKINTCEYSHPKVCQVFMKFGLQNYQQNGRRCNERCELLHPTVC